MYDESNTQREIPADDLVTSIVFESINDISRSKRLAQDLHKLELKPLIEKSSV